MSGAFATCPFCQALVDDDRERCSVCDEPLTIAWNGDVFERPAVNLGLGILIAVVMGAALLRISAFPVAQGASL